MFIAVSVTTYPVSCAYSLPAGVMAGLSALECYLKLVLSSLEEPAKSSPRADKQG